jgi:hypothetical protein
MKTTTLLAILFASMLGNLFAVVNATPALALANRAFVSVQGSDSNACTSTSPCRTFATAYNAVAAGGEIDVLDPGGFGALVIREALSIQGHGFSGLSVTSGEAIEIDAGPSDNINLRGLLLDGIGSGTNGIAFFSGASLNIQDCLIRDFALNGIQFTPIASSNLFVTNTVISDSGVGMQILPSTAGSTLIAVLDRVTLENNGSGFAVQGLATGSVNVTVSDSVVSKTTADDIDIESFGGPVSAMIRNSTVTNSHGNGILACGAGATVRVTKSAITDNLTGVATCSGGVLDSYGDNNIDGNTSNGSPTATIGLH